MSVRNLIFITPRANQGQTVEVSFAEEGGKRAWRKVVDHSLPVNDPDRVTYSRRAGDRWVEPTTAQLKQLRA
jgi:hypothetical protein